ncbi:MAG: hypothetical protein ACJ735_04080 [Actinomycetes bacterium]
MGEARLGAVAADQHTIASRFADVLDLLPDLRKRLGQPAGTLSGGEQQMVAIGRALMTAALPVSQPAETGGCAHPIGTSATADRPRDRSNCRITGCAGPVKRGFSR